jgi:hypothetical protein
MNGSNTALPGRPMSIEEISEKANEFFWNPTIPLKYWLRAAETLSQEVRRGYRTTAFRDTDMRDRAKSTSKKGISPKLTCFSCDTQYWF